MAIPPDLYIPCLFIIEWRIVSRSSITDGDPPATLEYSPRFFEGSDFVWRMAKTFHEPDDRERSLCKGCLSEVSRMKLYTQRRPVKKGQYASYPNMQRDYIYPNALASILLIQTNESASVPAHSIEYVVISIHPNQFRHFIH